MKLTFSAKMQTWGDDGKGWHYVRLPKDTHKDLQEIGQSMKRGFGAVKMQVTIGGSSWETSGFPDSEDKSYILFIKKAIRVAEGINEGDKVEVSCKVLQ